ncbi:MAG: hypothetical protein ACR2LN_08060 [Candidatus Levyibacteriota bacterium]
MEPAKKTRGIILIIGIYVVIALVGFMIVYFIKSTFFHPPQTTTAMKTHVSTTSPAPHPTGWRLFKNSSMNFTFFYPPDLTVKTNAYGMGVSDIEMRTKDNTNPSYSPNYQILFVPKAMAQAVGQDFDNYYSLPNNTTKVVSSPFSSNKSQQNLTKLSNATIDGHRALDYRSQEATAVSNNQAEIGKFIEDGENILLISGGESDKSELDHLMQSIKFTQ